MRSETISELAKVLSNFQGKMTAVKKDATNPFYKSRYATLDTIWEAIRKPLSENGLSIIQTMDVLEGKSVLCTTLLHTSGEWVDGVQLVNPVKDDPQSLGSAISYARRYSLSAILGIVADEDDDAEIATPKSKTSPAKREVAPEATKQPTKGVTPTTEPEKQGVVNRTVQDLIKIAQEKGYDSSNVTAIIVREFKKAKASELNQEQRNRLYGQMADGKLNVTEKKK